MQATLVALGYGPEAQPIRVAFAAAVNRRIAAISPDDGRPADREAAASNTPDALETASRRLQPRDDAQRSLQGCSRRATRRSSPCCS